MTVGQEGKGDLAAIFSSTRFGMAIVGLDGRFQQVSRSFCRLLGRTDEELVGRSFLEVTDPGDFDAGVDDLRRLVTAETEVARRDKRYRLPNGTSVWVRMSAVAVKDACGEVAHFATQIEDLTELRGVERRLEASEDRFRELFESFAVAMALTDLAGIVRFANVALSDLVGIALSALIGRPLEGVIAGLTKSDIVRAARRRTVTVGERTFVGAAGSSGWVLVAATRLGPGNDESALLAVRLIDITQLKLAEEALKEVRIIQ
jgi:PAS domain S-box-containing protein